MSPARIDVRGYGYLNTPARPLPARFSAPRSAQKVDLKEPSDVAALPGGGFLVVSDRSDRLGVVGADGRLREVELDGLKNGKSGLEAVAYHPTRKLLFVASEEKDRLLRYRFDVASGAPVLDAELRIPLGGARNKGIEGLALLTGAQSPTGRPQLVLAKEGEPKTLALLEEDGSGQPRPIALDARLGELSDFSALAVDPLTGHLFVSSDESAAVAELELILRGDKLEARLVQILPLRDGDGAPLERVEGITFDQRGNLHVLLENERELLNFERR